MRSYRLLAVLLSIIVVTVSTAPSIAATVNVASGAAVTLEGGTFFVDERGWGSTERVSGSTLVDGVFLPRNCAHDRGAVWWDSLQVTGQFIQIKLQSTAVIESLVVQADDNDAYNVYYIDRDSGTWNLAWHVSNYDTYGWGMQTRPNPANDAQRQMLGREITTNALRIEGVLADSNKRFAVSEVQAYGRWVSPPASITHTLTVKTTLGGSVTVAPGGLVAAAGSRQFQYIEGSKVTIEAVPQGQQYQFAGWTGSAVNLGKVVDPKAAKITVPVNGDCLLQASFQSVRESWSIAYANSFQSTIGSEWSRTTADVTPAGQRRFLGQFGNETASLTLQSLPSHLQARVSLDLLIIRSWDGDGTNGPDIWSLAVRSGPRLIRTTFDNHYFLANNHQSYPRDYPDGSSAPQTKAAEKNTLGYYDAGYRSDAVYHLTFAFAHSDPTLALDFWASGLEALSNESWGLDNVTVELAQTVIGAAVALPPPPNYLKAFNPSPPDGARNVVSPVLGWSPDPAAELHEIWFGTSYPLNGSARDCFGRQTSTSFTVPLAYKPETTYFWHIDEVYTQGSDETVPMGDYWSFTTASVYAHSPYPPDKYEWGQPQAQLSWGSGLGAAFHDVYIGTQQTLGASNYVGRVMQTEYAFPGFLSPGTTYYWRIDEVDADGKTIHSGPVWRFKVTDAVIVDDDAPNDPGPGEPARSDPKENGTAAHPYDSIQEAIDKGPSTGTILVRDGLYTDRDWPWTGIHFRGKKIRLRSENGPSKCIIDCQGKGRGFTFDQGEGSDSILEGFTIMNGYSGESGGGIQCSPGTSPQIRNCRIVDNEANQYGAGIYLTSASPTISGCVISNNKAVRAEGIGGIYCLNDSEPYLIDTEISGNVGDGISSGTPGRTIRLFGTVKLTANDLVGAGTIRLEDGACLELADCRISHRIAGPGKILIPAGSTTTIDGAGNVTVVDLSGDDGRQGTIECAGRLVVTNATLKKAYVNVRAAGVLLDEGATVESNTFRLDDPSGVSSLEVRGTINYFNGNAVHATDDDCLTINPKDFVGNPPRNDLIEVNLAGDHVFEVRGVDEKNSLPSNGEPCLIRKDDCPTYLNLTKWSLNKLTLKQGASVALTNRSQDQRGLLVREALYVETLVLEPNSVLNLAFNRLYYEKLIQAPSAQIINEPLLGWSLGQMDFSDPNVFTDQVRQNNFQSPDDPQYTRVHVEQVVGLKPDPAGMMRMRNLQDRDPQSATYGRLIDARAKVAFDKCYERSTLVHFSYWFESPATGLELVAYLSDVPELLSHDDPSRENHYLEIGRVTPPPEGAPGSPGSGRVAVFEEQVSTGKLDLRNGTWVELELVEAQPQAKAGLSHSAIQAASAIQPSGSMCVGGMKLWIYCQGICLDFNKSGFVNWEDAWLVYVALGSPTGPSAGGKDIPYCLDSIFSGDGYMDFYDTCSWDWAFKTGFRCGDSWRIPLSVGSSGAVGSAYSVSRASGAGLHATSLDPSPPGLLVLGKSLADPNGGLSFFSNDPAQAMTYSPPALPASCAIRLVPGPAKQVYVVGTEKGVFPLDGSMVRAIPSGKIELTDNPRYPGTKATVYIGLQKRDSSYFGRPIFDVAFDAQGDAYVVPVVVQPENQPTYLAAARLHPLTGANPPYSLVQLYDDAPPEADREQRNCLREIEIDATGNVYVLNAHRLNENSIVWKYAPNGQLLDQIRLMDPNSRVQVDDPIAMHVSRDGKLLYLASGQRHPEHPDSTTVYGLFTEDLSRVRTITVANMQQATSLVEGPETGSLWVAGYSIPKVPTAEVYASPCLAKVNPAADGAEAIGIIGASGFGWALPISVVWIGETN